MTVVVSFFTPSSSDFNANGIGRVRVREDLAVGDTTSASAQDGEMVLIGNAETSMVAAAWGVTPNAEATASTAATSAGIPIPAGQSSYPIVPGKGSKVNVKAVS